MFYLWLCDWPTFLSGKVAVVGAIGTYIKGDLTYSISRLLVFDYDIMCFNLSVVM